jgi:hypothetical protein
MTQKAIEARIGHGMTNECYVLFEWFTYELAMLSTKLSAAQRRIDHLEGRETNRAKADDSRNMAEFRKQMNAYKNSEVESA